LKRLTLTGLISHPRRNDVLAVVFLFLLPQAFFFRQTLGLLTLGDRDAVFWFYPIYKFVAEQLQQGRLPLLSPYMYCGTPVLAEWQAGVFDPLNWIYLVGTTSRTLTLSLQLAFSIALIGMYCYGRALGFNRRAGLVAAVIYGLSGFMVGRALYPGFLHIVALAPWVMLFVERLFLFGRRRDWIAGALIVAWQAFAAHPQPLIYSSLLACAYALFRSFSLLRRARLRYWLQVAGMFVGGGCLASIQLLPAAEFARESVRRDWPYELFTLHSLHPASLLTTLFPFFHGEGRGVFHMPFWGPYWHQNEAQIYLGSLALVLSIAGAALAWREGISTGRFWSVVAVIGVLLSMGKYVAPLARALFHAPIIGQFRSPNRHWMEVVFAVAVLAGFAVDRLLDGESRATARTARLAALLIAGFTVLIGGFTLGRRDLAEAAIRSFSDLQTVPLGFLNAAALEFSLPAALSLIALGVILLLTRARAGARWYGVLLAALIVDYGLYASFAPISTPEKLETLAGRAMPPALAVKQSEQDPIRYHLLLDPSTGEFDPLLFYGHEMTTGYDPLLNHEVKTFLGVDEAGRTFDEAMLYARDRTLDLLNVRYVFVPPERIVPDDRARWRELDERSATPVYRDYRIVENLRALPRVWLVDQVRTAWAGDQHKMIRGQIDGFDPLRVALVEPIHDPEKQWYWEFERSSEHSPPGIAKILIRTPTRWTIETETTKASVLVLSELALPGWKTSVDGKDANSYTVDYLLRATPIREAGKHTIEYRYEPASLKVGAILTFVSALVLLFLWRGETMKGR
jgi:hypothetical protein